MIRFFRFVMLFVPAMLPVQASGQGWVLDGESSLGMFVLGLASGYGAHELGHVVVASSKGYPVSHDGLSLVYPNAAFTDAGHLQVASAGFQTQWLMAELAFRDHSEKTESPGNFGAGVICAHLGITLAYLTVLKNHPQGDVAGIAEATQRSTNQVAWALAIPGALDAWRLFGNRVPEWVPQLSVASKGLEMAWVWSY